MVFNSFQELATKNCAKKSFAKLEFAVFSELITENTNGGFLLVIFREKLSFLKSEKLSVSLMA